MPLTVRRTIASITILAKGYVINNYSLKPAYLSGISNIRFGDERPRRKMTKTERARWKTFHLTQLLRFGGECPLTGEKALPLLAVCHGPWCNNVNHPHAGILACVTFKALWGNEEDDTSVFAAIHPDTLIVHIHPDIDSADAQRMHGKKFVYDSTRIVVSEVFLQWQWDRFVKNGGTPHGPLPAPVS